MLTTFNIQPLPSLKRFINNIWVVDSEGEQKNRLEKMIPYGCMDLVFVEKAGLTYHSGTSKFTPSGKSFLTGQVTQPYFMEYEPNMRMIGFGFYPHTAHLLTKNKSSVFTDELISFEDIVPSRQANFIHDQLASFQSLQDKVNFLQKEILEIIEKNISQQLLYTEHIIKEILNSSGQIELSEFQNKYKISKRYIQKLFKEQVGVSPVLFGKIIRFLKATSMLQNHTVNLTDIGYQVGYYDQSHFIRDFKRFSGLSPTKYMEEEHFLLDNFTSEESSSFLYNQLLE